MTLMFVLLAANVILLFCFILLFINYKTVDFQLKEQNKYIQNLNNIRMKTLSELSHDLRTPLNVIMGYTSLLLNKVHGEINIKQKDDIQRIKDNSNKMLTIIEDFFIKDYKESI